MIWALSPDHFALAWESTGHDTFPPPLRVQPTARTVDERRTQQAALNNWWLHTATGSEFATALRVLAAPSTRIEVFAKTDVPVRVLGVANGPTAVVVTQDPGPDPACGGTVHLRTTTLAALAEAVVGALPTRSPGTRPASIAAATDLQASRPTSVMYDPFHISDAQRLRRLLNTPRDGTGHLLITAGPFNDRPPQVLSWIDLVDDGRYLIRSGTDVECLPGTAEVFINQLDRMITAPNDPAPSSGSALRS